MLAMNRVWDGEVVKVVRAAREVQSVGRLTGFRFWERCGWRGRTTYR